MSYDIVRKWTDTELVYFLKVFIDLYCKTLLDSNPKHSNIPTQSNIHNTVIESDMESSQAGQELIPLTMEPGVFSGDWLPPAEALHAC